MKNLILSGLILVTSTIAANSNENNLRSFNNEIFKGSGIVSNLNIPDGNSYISQVEEDVPFDFDTKRYLPTGFDPFARKVSTVNIKDLKIEEADATFDFELKDYLPEQFNAFQNPHLSAAYEEVNEEPDQDFDFELKKYLPVPFNNFDNKMLRRAHEELNKTADAPFEFNHKEYLPKGFDPFRNTDILKSCRIVEYRTGCRL